MLSARKCRMREVAFPQPKIACAIYSESTIAPVDAPADSFNRFDEFLG
jgi:hypothetical protein